jgi:hypothetical protein
MVDDRSCHPERSSPRGCVVEAPALNKVKGPLSQRIGKRSFDFARFAGSAQDDNLLTTND